jgi:predicted kinase
VTTRAVTTRAVTTRALEAAIPGVIVLVGPAGSGKTTFAGRRFPPDEVLSSDDLRAAVSGDAADQSVTRAAFSILHRELERRLAAGRLVVVDATSLTVAARGAILRRATAARAPAVAVVLVPSPAEVHARNARRAGRVVPADVVDRQIAAAASLGADPAAIEARLLAEGFVAVRTVWGDDPAAADRLEIRRRVRTAS